MNTATATNDAPPRRCQFCDRKGLPILPLRYAVARKDKGNAPPLAAPFEVGSKEKNKTALALPADQAHYTLRLLRPGYLYVYDEHRKEWSAYQVAQGGYLFQFDPHAKAPPGGFGQASFACARTGDAMIARCITVKDAAKATKIWLGYSDVAWTPAVLAKHDDPAYRAAHMRSIDMAAVRGGGRQPHADGFSDLDRRVAEYATTPATLNAETAAYVQKYLPPPYKKPSALLDNTDSAKMALKMCSKLIVKLLPQCLPGPPASQGRTPSAAWAFSAADLEADGACAAAMKAWAEAAAKPYHGAIVALEDPAGVAMEINGLALQLSAEFCEEPERKWKHETALTIAALKEAVMHGAVEREAGWRKFWSDGLARMGESGGGEYGGMAMQMPGPDGKSTYDLIEEGIKEDDERIDKEVDEKADVIGQAEWNKNYAKLFNEKAQLDELSPTGSYAIALQAFARDHVQPLDTAFLGWLQSQGFTAYFTHNFDTKDIDHGLSYTQLLTLVVNQSGGRVAVAQYLAKAIQQDPTDPRALFARGFALNQDALARKWVEGAAEKAGESGAIKTLAEISEKVYDGYKGLMIAGNQGAVFSGLSKYTYQLSAGLVNALGAEITSVAAEVATSLGTRQLYAILGAVAREEDESAVLLDLSTAANAKQAAKMLNNVLTRMLGGGSNQYVSAASKLLSEKPGTFRGIVIIKQHEAENLLKANKGRTLSAAKLSTVVSPETFEGALNETAGKLLNGEVKGGVVGTILVAITCIFAHKEYAEATGGEKVKQGINYFMGSLTSLAGGMMEIGGNLVEKTSFGATKWGPNIKFLAIEMDTRASWLTGSGKLLGAAGGFVAGAIAIWDGFGEMNDGHKIIGYVYIALGGVSIIAAFLLLTTWAAAGFIVGLIIGLILLAIAIFKHNKVQDWLENARFGDGKLKPFKNIIEQTQALAALGKE